VKTGKTNPKSFDANFTNFHEFGEGKFDRKGRKVHKVKGLCWSCQVGAPGGQTAHKIVAKTAGSIGPPQMHRLLPLAHQG